MGYKTWESIGCKPLKNRINVVLTSKKTIPGLEQPDVYMAHTVAEVLDFYEQENRDLWVIGGALTFGYFRPWCDEAVVSTIEGDYTGDTYFTGLKGKLTEDNLLVTMKGEGFTVNHYKVK